MNTVKKEQQLLVEDQKIAKKAKSRHRHTSCGRCKNCKCNSGDKIDPN